MGYIWCLHHLPINSSRIFLIPGNLTWCWYNAFRRFKVNGGAAAEIYDSRIINELFFSIKKNHLWDFWYFFCCCVSLLGDHPLFRCIPGPDNLCLHSVVSSPLDLRDELETEFLVPQQLPAFYLVNIWSAYNKTRQVPLLVPVSERESKRWCVKYSSYSYKCTACILPQFICFII